MIKLNRKLQAQIRTIPNNNLFDKKSIMDDKKVDIQLKDKQKFDHDKFPSNEKGQAVWIKTPKTSQTLVKKTVWHRLILVKTNSGLYQHKNDHCQRNEETDSSQGATP